MTNEQPQPPPKRRRLRSEFQAIRRLLPFMRPYVGGIGILVFVTLVFSASNAGRAWLVMPLMNHIMLRGSSVVDNYSDDVWSKRVVATSLAAVNVEKNLAMVGYPRPNEEAELDRFDLGLGEPPLPRTADKPHRDDELNKLFGRSRAAILEAGNQVVGTKGDDPKARRDLMKAVRLELWAEKLVAPDMLVAPVASRDLAAALSVRGRVDANETMFKHMYEDLAWIFGAAIVIAILLGSFYFFMYYQARALVTRMVVDIQDQLAKHLLTLSIRYFNDEKRGELFSRLTNDLNQLNAVLMLVLSDVLIQPLQLGVLILAAVYVSPPLSLSLLALAFTVIIPVSIWGKRIRRSARYRQVSVAAVLESMQQMFAGIRIVKAFRREPYEMQRFQKTTSDYLKTSLRVMFDRTASKSWMELVNDVTIPVVLLAGGILVVNHIWGLDIGRFGSFLGLVVMMYMPAKTLASSYNTLQDAIPSVDRVFEILDSHAEIVEAKDAVTLPLLKDAIRFEDVTFGYLPGVPVLRNISFTARAGEVTAIVGPTTAGKSTLVDLIARFYDPTSGRITVDGIDLKTAKLPSLLDKIAVVTQDPFLFNDSIKENIRYGKLDATDAEVESAAKSAKIHDDIVAMADGYNTNVGERGAKLSGGQRQRVTIARAILKSPEILILDEAMSSLDATTERRVQEALEALEHGRTTFAIAHRLSTVQHAHKILVLEEGRLVEEGRHDELVAKGGLYASLVKNLAMGNGTRNGSSAHALPLVEPPAPAEAKA